MGLVQFVEKEPDAPHDGGSDVMYFREGTVRLSRIHIKKGFGAARHQHPEEQLVYVLEGSITVTLDDDSYDVGPGQASYHPPNSIHGLVATADTVVLSYKNMNEHLR